MPGFRYCSWCNGCGCIACDAEQKKWIEAAQAKAPKRREFDVRDIRDAVVEAEILRACQPGLAVDERGRIDALTPDEVEAALEPLLDAEYARQFPNGPEPIFVAREGNEMDMQLLKHVMHREVIEKVFGPEGGGMAEIVDLAAEARSLQRLHDAAEPKRRKAAEQRGGNA